MRTATLTSTVKRARRVDLRGRVQGLGVRPALARLAMRLGLAGAVRNTSFGVEVEVEGADAAIAQFLQEMIVALPTAAQVLQSSVASIEATGRATFVVAPSGLGDAPDAIVPVDIATCSECLTEVRQQGNRRFAYPFISCAACGPRYSLLSRMPYDRASTAMAKFPMCPACEREYHDCRDRRFHAENICCSACGPRLWASDGAGRRGDDPAQSLDAIAAMVREGGIAAIKGIGGYQLLADATNHAAVRRLRERKGRIAKPFAVMVSSLADAERLADGNAAERAWLTSPANPIVVLRVRRESGLAECVAPRMATIGLFLPSSALHALLLERIGVPAVCTSGNREGEPLAYDERDAEVSLHGIADCWLHHDREIFRPIDDSVVRIVAEDPCVLRLGRGLAPWTLLGDVADVASPSVLAVGGEMKSAVALGNRRRTVLGPHVGELTEVRTCVRWQAHVADLCELHALTPSAVAHDLHPDYFSTRMAEQGVVPRIPVQHHHAHAAAVLWEHRRYADTALALAWDGAGYGPDDKVWGGECLVASLSDYQRIARLLPFSLPGGDRAIREPWRVAVSLAGEAGISMAELDSIWPSVERHRLAVVYDLAGRQGLSPLTSSMGRLFDGVAALAFRESHAHYEGHFAMLLEAAFDPAHHDAYAFVWSPGKAAIDWRPVVRCVLNDVRAGCPAGAIAARFHRALANLAVRLAERYSTLPLVTCGGVFQNAVLNELIVDGLRGRGIEWLRPVRVPPGDGGLALGQLAVALARRAAQQH